MMGNKEQNGDHNTPHDMVHLKLWSTAPFLFKGWSLQSNEGLLAALLATVTLSVLRDCLAYSIYVHEKQVGKIRQSGLKTVLRHARGAGMHMINIGAAYMLMLCVMTYNIWLLVAVSLGAGLGHFFFRPIIEWAFTRTVSARLQKTTKAIPLETFSTNPDHERKLIESSENNKSDSAGIILNKSRP